MVKPKPSLPGSDDLIVATHGRSFWVLDDITPLRQLAQLTSAKNLSSSAEGGGSASSAATRAFLFAPQITTRIDNDAFSGTPLPPEEPTAENPPAGAILDYYLPAAAQSLELNIYTVDHKLVRHLSSAIPAKASHMDLPIADRWFPTPQRLETTPGHHRFIWNLAWGTSGVAESDEPDDGEGSVPRGPKVLFGTYIVEFIADGKALPMEQLRVIRDPRSSAKPADLQQTFTTTYSIFTDSLEARRALAEIESVKTQLSKQPSTKPTLNAESKALLAAIESVVSGSGKGIGLEQANTELTSSLNVAESSDRAIPAQALEVYAEARTASTARVQEWANLKKGPLAKFNEQLKSDNQKPIAISAIEHEVQILMTQ